MTTILQISNGFTPDTFMVSAGRVLAIAAFICIGAYFMSEFKTWKRQ
ncbi:hypothetical protein [Emticicia sp.]